ncbi:MAG TPA: aminoacyl-tRNA hydrolase [Candidatus Magasanikbacteria bacterium]|nr:aminoacyl-tRNA hydrolase [Candidatus Magasanikbacteria bacterium]
MKLIIGLGNPGKEYEKTRHNAGFLVVDALAQKLGASFKFQKKFNAEIAQTKLEGEDVLLMKPQTFMNLSGESVRAVMDFYKIKPKDIVVIQDDKDILFGQVKYQTDRSAAGHNGIKSIIEHLSTQEFARIRIGVAWKDKEKMGETAEFVLRNFSKSEMEELNVIIEEICGKILS